MDYAAGVDFGGTSAKIGLIGKDGTVLARDALPVDPRASFQEVLDPVAARLEVLSRQMPPGDRLVVIGIGMPGFIEKQQGTVVGGCENIPGLQRKSAQTYLARSFGVPAFSENDATSAAAAELIFGAGRTFTSFLLITLGTAIGGGLVLDGRVYRGSRGFAGEVGHICVVPDGVPCNCGSRGCFEQYASGTAMARVYREKLRKRGRDDPAATARTVADMARSGDEPARQTIEEAARYIAQALGSVLNLLDLQACLIGGGVAEAGDILLEPVRRRLPDYCWPEIAKGVQVLPAGLGNDAGILGAAAQALERLDGTEGA
ncbi:MAG TPA: ROK family protein [Spirochaetia bacterium]|nr:ROK family protein [Spirochaetia bacterium]